MRQERGLTDIKKGEMSVICNQAILNWPGTRPRCTQSITYKVVLRGSLVCLLWGSSSPRRPPLSTQVSQWIQAVSWHNLRGVLPLQQLIMKGLHRVSPWSCSSQKIPPQQRTNSSAWSGRPTLPPHQMPQPWAWGIECPMHLLFPFCSSAVFLVSWLFAPGSSHLPNGPGIPQPQGTPCHACLELAGPPVPHWVLWDCGHTDETCRVCRPSLWGLLWPGACRASTELHSPSPTWPVGSCSVLDLQRWMNSHLCWVTCQLGQVGWHLLCPSPLCRQMRPWGFTQAFQTWEAHPGFPWSPSCQVACMLLPQVHRSGESIQLHFQHPDVSSCFLGPRAHFKHMVSRLCANRDHPLWPCDVDSFNCGPATWAVVSR